MEGKYTGNHVPSGVRKGQEINLRGDSGQEFNTPNSSESLKGHSPYDNANLH